MIKRIGILLMLASSLSAQRVPLLVDTNGVVKSPKNVSLESNHVFSVSGIANLATVNASNRVTVTGFTNNPGAIEFKDTNHTLGVTIQAPSIVSSNYTIVWPSNAPPSSTQTNIVVVNHNGGVITLGWASDDAGTGGGDSDAIHDNVSGEIAVVTLKGTPLAADFLLIEDTAASNAKKSVTIGGLETALEGVMDLQDLQGAATDAQVPNNITIDLATLATTATTANAGDSATGFFPSGTLEEARLPTGINANKIAGGGVSSAEFDFLATLTSDVQTQLNARQPLDADLTALAAISGVQGDVIYHNGTSWVRLGAGTSGQFFETLGTGANPRWGTPAGSGNGFPLSADANAGDFGITNINRLVVNNAIRRRATNIAGASPVDLVLVGPGWARITPTNNVIINVVTNGITPGETIEMILEVGTTNATPYQVTISNSWSMPSIDLVLVGNTNNFVKLLFNGTNAYAGSMGGRSVVSDAAWSSTGWNGDNTNTLSRNVFNDVISTFDTDHDSLPDRVDLSSAGFVRTTAGGVLSATELSGDVTTSGSGTATIANDAVTAAKLANMAANTFKGRVTGSTGDPEDLTPAQALSVLESGGTDLITGTEFLWNNLGNPSADKTFSFAGFRTLFTSTLNGGSVFGISNTVADVTSDTFLIDLNYNDRSDPNAVYLRFRGDANVDQGGPSVDYLMTQTSFDIAQQITMTMAGIMVINGATGVFQVQSGADTDVPTAATGDNSDDIASTAFVQNTLIASNYLHRLGVVQESITIPSGAWRSNDMTATYLTPASAVSLTNVADAWSFANTVTNGIRTLFKPTIGWDAGVIRLGVLGYCGGTNDPSATNVVWSVRASAVKDGADITNPTFGTAVLFTNRISHAAFIPRWGISGDVTVGNSPAATNSILIEVTRLGAATGDTLTNVLGAAIADFQLYVKKNLNATWPLPSL